MWPPSSDDSAFACSTIAIAFQRTSAVASRSSSGIARQLRLLLDGNRVHVGRAEAGRDLDAVVLGVVDGLVEQEAHPVAPVVLHDGVDGVEPLARLDGLLSGMSIAISPSGERGEGS